VLVGQVAGKGLQAASWHNPCWQQLLVARLLYCISYSLTRHTLHPLLAGAFAAP
jgi:hypothetical protein